MQGLSEPDFYGDLLYKFRTIVGNDDFSTRFRNITIRYKQMFYSMNVMRQTACLVVNPIMTNNFTPLLNCTAVGRASEGPNLNYKYVWIG